MGDKKRHTIIGSCDFMCFSFTFSVAGVGEELAHLAYLVCPASVLFEALIYRMKSCGVDEIASHGDYSVHFAVGDDGCAARPVCDFVDRRKAKITVVVGFVKHKTLRNHLRQPFRSPLPAHHLKFVVH